MPTLSIEAVGKPRCHLDALRRRTYDIILMNVQMPEMDSVTAARRIAETYSVAERPWIIALIAAASLEERGEKHTKAGMRAHLCKPFNK